MRARSVQRWLTGVAAVLGVAAVGFVVRGALPSSGSGSASGSGLRSFEADEVTVSGAFSPELAQSRKVPRGHSLVAAARKGSIRVFRKPRARRSSLLRRRVIEGKRVPLRFMVVDKERGWVKVQLPRRPNRSTGWVRRSAIEMTTTAFRIVIQRRKHRLVLFRDGRFVKRMPIALGTAATPTPRGRYFVTDLIRSRDPFYGPYAFGLSAYSPVLTSYAGGDGQLGIHGTNQPGSIGRKVSHGCIRVSNAEIRRLARLVPLGTPVDIR